MSNMKEEISLNQAKFLKKDLCSGACVGWTIAHCCRMFKPFNHYLYIFFGFPIV